MANGAPLAAEMLTLRFGDLILTSFPGELSVRIGLAIKAASPHQKTFITSYSVRKHGRFSGLIWSRT